jgi:hypothetical protein
MRLANPLGMTLIALLLALASACATAQPPPSAPAITLSKAIHFLTPDGSDIVVSPGTYEVKSGSGPQLELTADAGQASRHQTVGAVAMDTGQSLASPAALYIPWGNDEHHIILVQPSGQGLEAVGSGSGVRPRGAAYHPLPGSVVKKALADRK